MKTLSTLTTLFAVSAAVITAQAIDLKESKVTQVVNDVQIISASSQSTKPASINDIFSIPDILRTGKASRAELVAKDETITRVGADTIFSFDPATRTIDLKQGSLLFHSPHGKGGGTIHTGSATASVLGTTLIVTTTKDGGMKVIDLEGTVEVNHQNKKKQRLNGGQMTFVLPSGQLAPVVMFKLDDLVRNSLLVRGFVKPLASLPLIQNQITKQDRLIKKGQAKDTGLLVGDTATPNQVEVIDPNSIQSITYTTGNARAALNSDATISVPSLNDAGIPTPPNRIYLNKSFTLAGNPFYAGQTFKGFAGRNINFTGPSSLSVDLTPYASKPLFDFVAANTLSLNTSVSFDGLASSSTLALIGGQHLTLAPGISATANVADFELSTAGSLTMNGVTLANNVGKLGLTSGSTIDLYDVHFYPAGTTTFTAPVAVNLTWSGDGFIGKLGAYDDNVINTDPVTGHVTLTASGNLNVDSTSIQTHFLTLNSGDSILLDAQGHELTASGLGATINLIAKNIGTVQNADLSSFSRVNMMANTLVVKNIILNPNAPNCFGTETGLASINSPIVNGRLNLINVHLGNTAITELSQINFTAGPVNTPGIISYKK